MANNKVNQQPVLPSPQGLTSLAAVAQYITQLVSRLNRELGDHARVVNEAQEHDGDFVDTNSVQTISNKTLDSSNTIDGATIDGAIITSPTGITKGDVGLGNVDNTSDVDKPVSSAQGAADALRSPIIRTVGQAVTGSITLVLSDAGSILESNSASAHNITVPPHSTVAIPANSQIDVVSLNTGQASFVAGLGVTLISDGSALKMKGKGSQVTLYQTSTVDTWVVGGGLVV